MDRSTDARLLLGIGTSFGLFLSDLEELATAAVVEAVRFALGRGRPVLPLSRWAEEEPELSLRRTLGATVRFHRSCQELQHLAREAQSQEEVERFATLYQAVARLQGEWATPFWSSIPSRFLGSSAGFQDAVPSARWTLDRAAELSAADPAQSGRAVERVMERLRTTTPKLEARLPKDPAAAREALLALLDLALMPAVGRLHRVDPSPWTALRLLPGGRLLAAAELLGQGEIEVAKPGWIGALCQHESLRWEPVGWLAFKAQELSPPAALGSRTLRRTQLGGAALRHRTADLPALLGSTAAPNLTRQALVARRRRALVAACVEVWVEGTLPPESAEASWSLGLPWSSRSPGWFQRTGLPAERFRQRLASTFEGLFHVPLTSLEPVEHGF